MKTKTIIAAIALLAAFNASAEPFTLEYSEEAPAGPVTFYGVDADQWGDRMESDSLSDSFRQEIKKAIETKLMKTKQDLDDAERDRKIRVDGLTGIGVLI